MKYNQSDIEYLNKYIKDNQLDDEFYKEVILDKASYKDKGKNYNDIEIHKEFRRMTFVIENKINVGNYGGSNGKEAFFGLNKVFIFAHSSIIDTHRYYLCTFKSFNMRMCYFCY